MSDTASAWASDRPIYSRLPGVNGRYNSEEGGTVADWLTQYFDELLVGTKTKVDDLHRQLDPTTCEVEWLDFLAQLCGFTGEYWDKAWSVEVRRSLLSNAFQGADIWANKGSQAVLQYLLDTFGIAYDLWLGGGFYAGVTVLPGRVGSPKWRYYVRLPLEYLRDSLEFKRAEQINRLYGPAFAQSRVCYRKFYAGFSTAGDPCFEA